METEENKPLKGTHVVAFEDGSEHLVAIVNKDKGLVQVTGLVADGIGCCWVPRVQLRKAKREDYERLGATEPTEIDTNDDAGDDAGDTQA